MPTAGWTLRLRISTIFVVAGLLLPLSALPAHAVDDATLAVTPAGVVGGSTGNTFTFTFTSHANNLAASLSTLVVQFDKGFGLPQMTAPAGVSYLQAQNVDCLQPPTLSPVIGDGGTHWLVTVGLQCNDNKSFTLTYSNVTAPATNATYPFAGTLTGAQAYALVGSGTSIGVGEAPQPPVLNSAVGGDGAVDLTWSAPSAGTVTGFQVQRSTTSLTSGFADLGAVQGAAVLTMTDTTVTNGTEYYYRVLSVNSFGRSSPSTALAATPNTAPGAPTLDTATGGDTQVVLSWTPGSGTVTSYRVQRAPDVLGGAGAYSTVANVGNVVTYTDTGLTNGTPYWFRIVPLNGTSVGPASTGLTATPQAAALVAPGAPDLTGATAGDNQVVLSWGAPTSGGAVATYRVERAEHVAGVVGVFSTLQANLTGLSHTDLTAVNGTTYSYRVAAVNAAGESLSNVRSATPQAPALVAPGAPDLTGATAGDNQVVLSWGAPMSGGAVATYRVERAEHVAGVTGAFSTAQAGLTALSHTDASAVNGTTYSYRVVAVNAAGESTSNVRSATPQLGGGGGGGGGGAGGGGGGGPVTVPTTPPTTPPQVGRCVDVAPHADFRDVPVGHVHERSIDCIAWKGITTGTSAHRFSPERVTTRGQMASFLARTVQEAGVAVPPARDRFQDDQRSVHHGAINQLAGAGIVAGTGAGRFEPGAPVSRGQMATMLANTYAYIRDERLRPQRDHFADDTGTVHEANINVAADLGLTIGRTATRYEPGAGTRRAQMASFLTRLLELLG